MLFSPLEIRGVRLKNRVVVAPMHQYSAVEGFATDRHLVNAGKYAQGGAGLKDAFRRRRVGRGARAGRATPGQRARRARKERPEQYKRLKSRAGDLPR